MLVMEKVDEGAFENDITQVCVLAAKGVALLSRLVFHFGMCGWEAYFNNDEQWVGSTARPEVFRCRFFAQ